MTIKATLVGKTDLSEKFTRIICDSGLLRRCSGHAGKAHAWRVGQEKTELENHWQHRDSRRQLSCSFVLGRRCSENRDRRMILCKSMSWNDRWVQPIIFTLPMNMLEENWYYFSHDLSSSFLYILCIKAFSGASARSYMFTRQVLKTEKHQNSVFGWRQTIHTSILLWF